MRAEDATPEILDALKLAIDYLSEMTTIFDEGQAERFYQGLVNKVGVSLPLPEWQDVKARFQMSGLACDGIPSLKA